MAKQILPSSDRFGIEVEPDVVHYVDLRRFKRERQADLLKAAIGQGELTRSLLSEVMRRGNGDKKQAIEHAMRTVRPEQISELIERQQSLHLQLWAEYVVTVEGYEVDGKPLLEYDPDNWQDHVPIDDRREAGRLMIAVALKGVAPTDPRRSGRQPGSTGAELPHNAQGATTAGLPGHDTETAATSAPTDPETMTHFAGFTLPVD